jgi:hypothetical protein
LGEGLGARERDLEWWAGGKKIVFGGARVKLDCNG